MPDAQLPRAQRRDQPGRARRSPRSPPDDAGAPGRPDGGIRLDRASPRPVRSPRPPPVRDRQGTPRAASHLGCRHQDPERGVHPPDAGGCRAADHPVAPRPRFARRTRSRAGARRQASRPTGSTLTGASPRTGLGGGRTVTTSTENEAPAARRVATSLGGRFGTQNRPLRQRLRLPLMLAGPIVVALGAGWWYLTSGRYVETDDAYIQAGKTMISPDVAGRVIAVEG